MADKKLNEVQKVTDMAYVPVIMADGSIGQIAKADLASVVAEQIKPASGIMKDYLNFMGSCNDVLEAGIRYIYGAYATDSPYSGVNGLLVTFKSSFKTLNSDYVSQVFYANPSGVFERFNATGKSDGWSPWQRIDNFGCNSLAELSAGVAGVFNKSYAQDMNDAVGHNESGMYSNTTLNLPSGLTGVGVYTVFRAKYEANDSLFLVQMLFPEDSASYEVYIRKCWNNTWTSWRRIATPMI